MSGNCLFNMFVTHSSSDEDGSSSFAEAFESAFSLALVSVAVNAGRPESAVVKVVVKVVSALLCFCED